jgi:hypothetical protein
MSLNFQQSRQSLQDFDFANLFIEVLGWSNPSSVRPVAMEIEGDIYQRKMVAELSGGVVLEVMAADGKYLRRRCGGRCIRLWRSCT